MENSTLFNPKTEVEKRLALSVSKSRIPISCLIQLTHRCNFSCKHCYLEPERESTPAELTVTEWTEILKTLKNMGCVILRLSGGEPLMYKDFKQLYEVAWDMGFRIEIATNCSMFNSNGIMDLLALKKPMLITISLYGASNNVYDKFCETSNGWDNVKKCILNMFHNNLNMQFHTILNKYNFNELYDMKEFAQSLSIPFKCYRRIQCDSRGGAKPIDVQIELEEEIKSYQTMNDLSRRISLAENNVWENGYKMCFAGLGVCYIDPYGQMYLCNGSFSNKYNIKDFGFKKCWAMVGLDRINIIEAKNKCSCCEEKSWCGMCNPLYLQKSSLYKDQISSYCEYERTLKKLLLKGDNCEKEFYNQ